MARKMNRALEGAKLIGKDNQGRICVWSGGYSFNVYDALNDWQEVRHFSSGQMVEFSDEETARQRMENEGFEVIG